MIRSTYPVTRKPRPAETEDMMGMLQEFLRLAPQVLNAHAEMKQMHDNISTHLSSVKQGPQGVMGAPGRPGRDGKDPDHQAIADLLAKKVRMPRDGKNGKDGKSVSPQEVVQHIIDKKLLKPEHVSGLNDLIEGVTKKLSGFQYGKDTWARGGGDTVSAGSGITITTDTNGKKVIAASTSGTNVYGEDLSSQAPGTSFTLAHTPTSGTLRLYRGGSRQREGASADYTLSGATITFNTTVASGEIITADYAY